MLGSTNKYFQQLLDTYLRTKIRVDDKIEVLASHINRSCGSKARQPSNSFAGKRELIVETVLKLTDPFQVLKMILLVHKCISLRVSPELGDLLGQFQSVTLGRNPENEYMKTRLLDKYISYLQKRICFEIDESEPGQILDECFRHINLLKKGLQFIDALMPIIRYYQPQLGFLIDLNITLASDLKHIYEDLTILVERLDVQNEHYAQLIAEIDAIHEGMFIVYYNCYNCYYVFDLHPRWIETEVKMKRHRLIEKKKSGESRVREAMSVSELLEKSYCTPNLHKTRSSSTFSTAATALNIEPCYLVRHFPETNIEGEDMDSNTDQNQTDSDPSASRQQSADEDPSSEQDRRIDVLLSLSEVFRNMNQVKQQQVA